MRVFFCKLFMAINTRHGIHITEKAGSYHMSSENCHINLKACETLPIVRRISLYLELISDKRGDRTSIIAMAALSAKTITPPELRYLTSL